MTQWLTQTLSFLLAATIVQNKAVAEQGLEEGEEEENRRNGQVEDMELSWMKECFTALELHADEPDVQVCLTLGSRVLHGTPEDLNLCINRLYHLRKLRAGPFTVCYCTELHWTI